MSYEITVEGKTYKNIGEMCKFYGISDKAYYRNRKKCSSVIDAIHMCQLPKYQSRCSDVSKRTDHNGVIYDSYVKMLEHYNVSHTNFKSRIQRGWSLEEALTGKHYEYYDHTGKGFYLLKDMLTYWGVDQAAYYLRLEKGWSLEDILTKKTLSLCDEDKRTDHEGRVFDSVKDMFNYWNVDHTTFSNRKKLGWSLKDCLTGRGRKSHKPSIEERTDPFGNVYSSLKRMCEQYGTDTTSYRRRVEAGYSLMECLTILPLLSIYVKDAVIDDNLIVLRYVYHKNKEMFYVCNFKGAEEVLSKSEIFKYVLNTYKEREKAC